jgi:aminopeptidase N
MKYSGFISIAALTFLFGGCSLIGLNMKHKTPKKASVYPVFTEKDTIRGSITPFRKNNDVTFYNISLDVDVDHESIKGNVEIRFTPLEDLDTIQIDLYANMIIDSILMNTQQLKYRRIYNAVFVGMQHTISRGLNTGMRVYYHGNPLVARRPPWEGGFVWSRDKHRKPWVAVACEEIGASIWWPVKDHIYDEPDSVKMSVTIPKGLFCVSNGTLKNQVEHGDFTTFNWETHYPINTYDITINIGDYRHFSIPYPKNPLMKLDFYVLPNDLSDAKVLFQNAVGVIEAYEFYFGEYPWIKDDYKLVESPFAGMEHQTAIAYGKGFKDNMMNNYIIIHETAHEWWGNSVSAPDYAEVWLQEGFATYSEALFAEKTKGHDAYQNLLRFYAFFIRNKQPVVGPAGVNYWNYKDGDVYMKGALTLYSLRNAIDNDPLFFDILKSFYQSHKYRTANTNEFIALVNEKTGKDYTTFFQQYLYHRECPNLQFFNYQIGKGQSCFAYRMSNTISGFRMPIEVYVNGKLTKLSATDKTQYFCYPSQSAFAFYHELFYSSAKKNRKLGKLRKD